jgi:hypothetical protein
MKHRLIALFAVAALCAGCTQTTAPVAGEPTAAESAAIAANTPAPLPPPDMTPPATSDDDEPQAGVIGTPDDPEIPPTTIAVGEPNPGAPDVVDTSCKTDADCRIKDVGSCCGYRPACVNANSPTFPEQVQAACAKDGRMGICGFPAITGCTCTAGKCEGTGSELVEPVH